MVEREMRRLGWLGFFARAVRPVVRRSLGRARQIDCAVMQRAVVRTPVWIEHGSACCNDEAVRDYRRRGFPILCWAVRRRHGSGIREAGTSARWRGGNNDGTWGKQLCWCGGDDGFCKSEQRPWFLGCLIVLFADGGGAVVMIVWWL